MVLLERRSCILVLAIREKPGTALRFIRVGGTMGVLLPRPRFPPPRYHPAPVLLA
jgi:hypothetical protein